MRWMSFTIRGAESFGLVSGDGVVDAPSRLDGISSLKALLAADALPHAAARLAELEPDHGLDEVNFLPVIPRPEKILCVGLNYRAHQQETGREASAYPMIFTRFAASQTGHGQPMIRPLESERLDYEGEIAMIIGRGGRRIPVASALDHVAGYSCYNDGSVRDFQRHTSQFTPGKNFPGTGAFGPWMTAAEAVGEPARMHVTTRLNGERMQASSAELLIFGFAELIAYCSSFTELAPGDVIVTGTPGGVGVAREPPVFLKPGDLIEVEVEPIGVLRNPVIEG